MGKGENSGGKSDVPSRRPVSPIRETAEQPRREAEFASGTNRADLSAPVYREPHFNNELLPRTTPRKRQAFIRGLADNRMRRFASAARGRQFVTMPDNKA